MSGYGRVVAAAARPLTVNLPSLPHRPSLSLSLQTSRLARLAAGAVTLTVPAAGVTLLATAVPAAAALSVDFRARAAARGVIPNTFPRRETARDPSETLAARLIDRALRPALSAFPPLAIAVRLLATDRPAAVSVDALAANAASAAAAAAAGTPLVGAARVARVAGRYVAFPSLHDVARADASLFVAARDGRVLSLSVDAGTGPAAEPVVADLLREALRVADAMVPPQRELLRLLEERRAAEGRTDFPRQMPTAAEAAGGADARVSGADAAAVRGHAREVYERAFVDCRAHPGKAHRADVVTRAQQAIVDAFPRLPMDGVLEVAAAAARDAHGAVLRRDRVRMDGRAFEEVRPVRCETALLGGAVHGSALFERGDTQVLACATIGLAGSAQKVADHVDTADGLADAKSFFLHYAFPGYATGEEDRFAGGAGGGSRREVGHGALAEAALRPLVGPADGGGLPYATRVSAEVTASDGSSSMATVCAGTLALLDAGVELREPVAGVAVGLVAGDRFGLASGADDDDCVLLTDILGAEDHFGAMDCKLAGTAGGITAAQLDVKLSCGLPAAVVDRVLDAGRVARRHILSQMSAALPARRSGVPDNAPRSVRVPVDRQLVVKSLLRDRAAGLREIESASGTRLFLEQAGGDAAEMRIDAPSAAAADEARRLLRDALADMAVGTRVRARVVETRAAYALVEAEGGGCTGMLHVSKMNLGRPGAGGDAGGDAGGRTPDQLRYPDVRRVLRKDQWVDVVCVESCRKSGVLRFGLAGAAAGAADAFLEKVAGARASAAPPARAARGG